MFKDPKNAVQITVALRGSTKIQEIMHKLFVAYEFHVV